MKTTTATLMNIIGWTGVTLILSAYLLLSFGTINGQSYTFQIMMLLGSAAIALEAWSKHDKQPTVLNIVFMVIALSAIIRITLMQ